LGTSQICLTGRKQVHKKMAEAPVAKATHWRLPCSATGHGWANLKSSARAHAIGVERVSEKHADAEEYQERRHYLGHGRALVVAMPVRAALRNCR
jgi:hypothetical protein